MKKIFAKSFVLGLAFIFIQMSSSIAIADCTEKGSPNGASCSFSDCNPPECISEVCFNGICVECAQDSDCSDGKSCAQNTCQ